MSATMIMNLATAINVINDFGKFLNGCDILITHLPNEHQKLEVILNAVEYLTKDMDDTYGCINNMSLFIDVNADFYPHINEDEKLEGIKSIWSNWTKNIPEWAGCSKEDFLSFVDFLSTGEDFSWEQALSLALNNLTYSQRWGWEYQQ